MTPENPPKDIKPQELADQLYDIALDPQSLDSFIDVWTEAGLDASAARKTIRDIDAFDQAYSTHLKRADTFLARGAAATDAPDLAAFLAPFDTLAAFIVDKRLHVVAGNSGAEESFGVADGVRLSASRLPLEALDAVSEALLTIFRSSKNPDHLLKVDLSGERAPALFQFRKLSGAGDQRSEHVLVVTTRYHWQSALGQTLEDVFGLTTAEQGVVRALVEGLDAKAISAERGTSEGTVRGQIKSILTKMNARTQSEVIRLVMSLRDVAQFSAPVSGASDGKGKALTSSWLQTEVWKPFQTLTLPDGRRLDYHDMGPVTGVPVIYSHMGYCMARWHEPMLRLAFAHGLRVICPIRAGYGHSDNLDPKADVLKTTRDDTKALLKHLGIDRAPYLTQGNDLIFAADFAGHFPEMVSEIIGICARPCLPGDRHYAGMGKWHRFFLSTAQHAPHLLKFTAKAAVTMAKRIGVTEMFRQMHRSSPADMAVLQDDELLLVLEANAELIAGKDTNVAQAYAMEILETEADWSGLLLKCQDKKIWFINGAQDPSMDVATIAEYREAYPSIEIEVIPEAGQLLMYQHYEYVIPLVAEAAKRA